MADSTRSRRDESSGGAKARRCVYLTVYDRLRRVSAMLSITFTYGSRLNQAATSRVYLPPSERMHFARGDWCPRDAGLQVLASLACSQHPAAAR